MTSHGVDVTSVHQQSMMGNYGDPNFMANTGNHRNFSNFSNQCHGMHPSNFSPPYTPDEESPNLNKNAFMNISSLIQNGGGNHGELPEHLHDLPDTDNFSIGDKLNGLENISHEALIPNINEFPTQSLIDPEKIYESSVRILYTSVSWARSIPTFVELPFADQALLLEECWSELFILCMIQCSVPMDLSVLLSAAGAHAEKELSQNVPCSVQDLKTLQHIVQRFQNLAIDATEFACLKATVLFKPGLLQAVIYFLFLVKNGPIS